MDQDLNLVYGMVMNIFFVCIMGKLNTYNVLYKVIWYKYYKYYNTFNVTYLLCVRWST